MSRLHAVPAANNLYSYRQASTEPEGTEQWTPAWTYRRNVPKTGRTDHWTTQGGYWPRRSGFTSDPAIPSGVLADTVLRTGDAEPWSGGFNGHQGRKFLRGQCVDAGAVPVVGAVVQAFLTATDAFQSESPSTDGGYYEVGTVEAGAHYLVAYKPGSPDVAGTTVNTLIPTNRDGT